MGILATHRVINSSGQTVGFIIDGNYTNYYDALKNISLIDNLVITSDGVSAKEGELPVQLIKDVNEKRYCRICNENPLKRDVQSELNLWKKNWNSKVLYISGGGARQEKRQKFLSLHIKITSRLYMLIWQTEDS